MRLGHLAAPAGTARGGARPLPPGARLPPARRPRAAQPHPDRAPPAAGRRAPPPRPRARKASAALGARASTSSAGCGWAPTTPSPATTPRACTRCWGSASWRSTACSAPRATGVRSRWNARNRSPTSTPCAATRGSAPSSRAPRDPARRRRGDARPAARGARGPAGRGRTDRRASSRDRGAAGRGRARGRRWAWCCPGLVNAHTHLYSALARGMPRPSRAAAQLRRDPGEGVVAARPRARRGVDLPVGAWWAPSTPRSRAPPSSSTTTRRRRIIAGSLGTHPPRDRGGRPALGPLLRGDRPQRCRRPRRRARRERGLSARGRRRVTRGMIGAHASFTLCEDGLAAAGAALARRRARACTCTWRRTARTSKTAARATASRCPSGWTRHGLLRTARAVRALRPPHAGRDPRGVHGKGGLDRPQPALEHEQRGRLRGLRPCGAPRWAPTASTRTCWRKRARRSSRCGRRGAPTRTRRRWAARRRPSPGCGALRPALRQARRGRAGRPGGPRLPPPTAADADNLAGHLLFGIDRSHVPP